MKDNLLQSFDKVDIDNSNVLIVRGGGCKEGSSCITSGEMMDNGVMRSYHAEQYCHNNKWYLDSCSD